MILGVMTLEQWIAAHHLRDPETQEWNPAALEAALAMLGTQVQMLLISHDTILMETFNQFIQPFNHAHTLFTQVTADETPEAYIEGIREAHRTKVASDIVVSFISFVAQIAEFTHLSYHNPGKTFQHYHQWLTTNLPIFPRKYQLVMLAGELVRQDRKKFLPVLIPIAQQQFPEIDIRELIEKVSRCLILEEAMPSQDEHGKEIPGGLIYRFKMGLLEESQFDSLMVQSLEKHTQIKLSIDQFNTLWQATNPDFDEIKPYIERINLLSLRQAGYELESISYTNDKDMRHLTQELKLHDQDYVLVNGQLAGFAGIPLSTSFIEQKTTPEMMQDILKTESWSHSMQFISSLNPCSDRPIYVISSSSTPHTELASMHHPRVQFLLNWDGSDLHTWVEQQLAQASILELKAK